jgi:ABC-2 type transport system permease protein
MTFIYSLYKELLEQKRTYRFLVLAVILLFFSLLSPLAAKFSPQLISMVPGGEELSSVIPTPTLLDAIGQYVKNISQFGMLMAIFLAMGMVIQEKDKGTAAMILVKPMSRLCFLLAKFSGLSLVFLACLVISGASAYYYTGILFTSPDFAGWFLMNGLLFVYMEVYLAITLLFSTLMRSQAAAVGLSFGVLLVLGLAGTLGSLGQYLPAQLITWGASLAVGQTTAYWPALVTSVGLVAVCLLAASLVFKHQEL